MFRNYLLEQSLYFEKQCLKAHNVFFPRAFINIKHDSEIYSESKKEEPLAMLNTLKSKHHVYERPTIYSNGNNGDHMNFSTVMWQKPSYKFMPIYEALHVDYLKNRMKNGQYLI